MIKIFKIAICLVVVLMALGCEEDSFNGPTSPDLTPGRPTVPLKKRPIVPSTKLPRPRVVEDLEADIYAVEEF